MDIQACRNYLPSVGRGHIWLKVANLGWSVRDFKQCLEQAYTAEQLSKRDRSSESLIGELWTTGTSRFVKTCDTHEKRRD
uniref:Uncharacterized protein n=1 Tax=Caenorhabditis japonica TaxID=281687 RepID=A0A8R1EDT3_CAEJA